MIKDICIREEYTDRDGVERVSWNKIGILIDGDKQYVKLNHIPNVLCSVFDQKKKGERQATPLREVPSVDVAQDDDGLF